LAEIDAGLADIGRSQAARVWSTWMGRNLWFIWGADPADLTTRLNGAAAVTEQTDGWVIFDLTGADAVGVLARLTPLDLHPDTFPPGTSARTDLAHMAASVTALGEGFRIMAMRSFAGTLMHDLEAAMRSIAGQRDIL
ncbi:MAG: sarcosine oxidase subunit gamma, partial [Pseudomonadota bacterium]